MNKVTVYAGIVFLLIGSNVFSQILVGPVVGGQMTWVSFDDEASQDEVSSQPVFNFHAGGSVAFRVQKRFFLQTSILYMQRGKVIEGKSLDPSLRNEVNYQYLDMPILYTAEFKGRIGQDKVFKWYFGVGPNVSYWLGGKGVLRNGDLNENLVNPPDYTLPYKIVFKKDPEFISENEMNVAEPNRLQLGLNFSAGLIVEPFGEQKFMLTTRYMLGHSFFSPTSNGQFGLDGILYYQDDLRVRNQEVVLSLHYFIDLKTEERNKGKSTSKVKTNKRKR